MSQTDYDQIVQLLCDRLADLSKTPEESISPETNLITQLSIDSIKLLGLVMEIEKLKLQLAHEKELANYKDCMLAQKDNEIQVLKLLLEEVRK